MCHCCVFFFCVSHLFLFAIVIAEDEMTVIGMFDGYSFFALMVCQRNLDVVLARDKSEESGTSGCAGDDISEKSV